jgi:hypothetical protein
MPDDKVEKLKLYINNTPKPPRLNTIYFVKCNEFVKIGITNNSAEGRLTILQVANPYKLTLLLTIQTTDQTLEKQLHQRFDQYHVRGEWFFLSREIQEYIANEKYADGFAAAA